MTSWLSSSYILLIMMCVTVLGTKHRPPERKLYDSRLKTGHTTRDREKRAISALVKIGLEVLDVLLTGTKVLPTNSKLYKRYEKPGNINTALFDFKGVVDKSRGVNYLKAGKMQIWSGYRGDRHLMLKDPGATGDPVLMVKTMRQAGVQYNGVDIAKIIYRE